MKELSIKEKAHRYDEAFGRAKEWSETKNGYYTPKELCEEIFPELAKSEDEKVRKSIIAILNNYVDNSNTFKPKMLAWLEKQGQKPQGKSAFEAAKEEKVDNQNCVNPADESKIKPKFKTGDRVISIVSGMPYFITEVCDDHYYTESGCIIMFCSQDNFELYEQKLADKVESGKKFTPIESALKDLICDVDNSYTIEQARRFLFEYGYKDKILNAAQEEMQKPAEWSEEDEKIALSIEQVMNCASLLNMVPEKVDKIKTWLKSIKDRALPQSKQEWSALDEKNLSDAILFIKTGTYSLDKEKLINWLKSLRPQSQWKPSDEQMKALKEACDEHWEPDGLDPLYTLYQDLKKLRKE